MAAQVTIAPETKAEAAAWLARMRADDRTAADQRVFQAWLEADPANRIAFHAITQVWDAAGAITRSDRDLLERDDTSRAPRVSRRAVMASVSALIVVGGTLGVWRAANAGVYQTEVGEQKHLF